MSLYVPCYRPYNKHNTTQTSMPPVGMEPTILASMRPQTDALDRAVTVYNIKVHKPTSGRSGSSCSLVHTDSTVLGDVSLCLYLRALLCT